jgi:hypothetical protein
MLAQRSSSFHQSTIEVSVFGCSLSTGALCKCFSTVALACPPEGLSDKYEFVYNVRVNLLEIYGKSQRPLTTVTEIFVQEHP